MQYSALSPALRLLAPLKLSFLTNLLFLLAFQYLSFSKSQHQIDFGWCCVSFPATAHVSISCYNFATDALVLPLCLPCNTMSSGHNTLLLLGDSASPSLPTWNFHLFHIQSPLQSGSIFSSSHMFFLLLKWT